MPYTILIDHTSSDSYNSERRETEIPIIWNDLDRAKEALRRIREVARFDSILEDDRWSPLSKVDRIATEKKLFEATHLPDDQAKMANLSMRMPLDDGTEQHVGTFWRGWGERLHCATIIETVDDEMRFCPEELPYDWYKS